MGPKRKNARINFQRIEQGSVAQRIDAWHPRGNNGAMGRFVVVKLLEERRAHWLACSIVGQDGHVRVVQAQEIVLCSDGVPFQRGHGIKAPRHVRGIGAQAQHCLQRNAFPRRAGALQMHNGPWHLLQHGPHARAGRHAQKKMEHGTMLRNGPHCFFPMAVIALLCVIAFPNMRHKRLHPDRRAVGKIGDINRVGQSGHTGNVIDS